MSEAYAQRFLTALLSHAADPATARILGEWAPPAKVTQPHLCAFVERKPGDCLGVTCGLSGRPTPLPVDRGLQYFELCAQTAKDSPKVLEMLSDLGLFILGALAPMLYGTHEQAKAKIAKTQAGDLSTAKPFQLYESIQYSPDVSLLLIPRWKFWVPEGPPVEVVEPLPIDAATRARIGELSLEQRAAPAQAFVPQQQWRLLFPEL